MRRLKRRAAAALILAALVLIGLGVFCVRIAVRGESWAMARFNRHLYDGGVLRGGTVTDRTGLVLARTEAGQRLYAESAGVRVACLHAVGDFSGNIGAGALSAFAGRLSGYDRVNGLFSDGEPETLALSIDARLCETAYSALAGRRGAVLVSNYETGEILCMVSAGSYDPAAGVPDLTDSANEGVFLNRGLSAVYTPGSVFKLVTAAAAAETLPDLAQRRFACTGSVEVGGQSVVCSGVHGTQTFEQALANSCNCAFAQLSLELGADTLAAAAEAFGLTTGHAMNGVATAAGSFEKEAAGTAALAWSGIGQGRDLVNPYAMLRLMGAVARGGRTLEPGILLGERAAESAVMSADTAQTLKELMANNVASAYGSGNFPGLRLCAKSGTAEVGDGTSHAWFVGFLDDEDHPLAFTVVIEHGGSGLANAGTLANTVLQAALAAGY